VAREGGTLVRTGHTEAAVDIARLAGLNPSGVICEIMNEDGSMARRDDLIAVAQRHGLKIGTIADLIAYRLRHDRIIERGDETVLKSEYGGEFRMYVYTNRIHHAEHVALVKGDVSADRPTLVRMHALNVLDDVLGCTDSGKGGDLQASMKMIGQEGHGVVVLIREPHPTALSERVAAQAAAARGDALASTGGELRDYGVGAQILLDLGVRDMVLLSNTPKTIIGIEGYGLKVVDQRLIQKS
jgi:3,4-dihydroxy 2-butanone 4-phosphate synthase/GTP cyclohydrolase II